MCFEMISSIIGTMEFFRFLFDGTLLLLLGVLVVVASVFKVDVCRVVNERVFFPLAFFLAGDGVGNGVFSSVLMRMCFEMISSIFGAMELRRFLFDTKLGVDIGGDAGGGVRSIRFLVNSSVFIVISGAGGVVDFRFGF